MGDGSAGLRRIRPGTRVFAEGPYGAFTGMHRRAPNALLIAGGVGITPIRALLEELAGHVVVLYRVNTDADAVLLRELAALAHRRGAVVHLLSGPPNAAGAYGRCSARTTSPRSCPMCWSGTCSCAGRPG